MDKIFIFKLFLYFVNISLLTKVLFDLNEFKFEYSHPIDYIIKEDLDKCYLSVHNLVSFNTTIDLISRTTYGFKDIKIKNSSHKQSFNTYISSYTKPFLIELMQNSTKDCLCCI